MTKIVLGELERALRDVGVSLRRLGATCGVSEPHLSQVFAGKREPSIPVLTAMSRALGGDLSVHFYPRTGPVVHDGVQSRIVEELLRIAGPVWSKFVEVPVFRPARGFIDVVFDSDELATTVTTEVESRIDRLEQQLRWAQEKAASLPSSELWARTEGERTIIECSSCATPLRPGRSFGGSSRASVRPTRPQRPRRSQH